MSAPVPSVGELTKEKAMPLPRQSERTAFGLSLSPKQGDERQPRNPDTHKQARAPSGLLPGSGVA
ncbi:uncharacterized protein ColSpa_12558 [Colletotrichum spaethianum]|uniref:Uncharacterized protein n=1 Tax=Colletotrichum spaethianum TaxID=700344 RepID=A0AA37PHS5_9PEZI|nr:uncharacterized protein ColSpa_12558 [Colletotrichum spaethianum]GKT52377.1 hypothetical protein ColSpa_12558 [Colletotrichum spaethianum]